MKTDDIKFNATILTERNQVTYQKICNRLEHNEFYCQHHVTDKTTSYPTTIISVVKVSETTTETWSFQNPSVTIT